MASHLKNLSQHQADTVPSCKGKKIGIVVSEYHQDITFKLLQGCVDTLLQYGAAEKHIDIIYVPGAYELTFGAKLLSQKKNYHSIICLGCVIKGDTDHDKYINHAVAEGLTHLSLQISKPVVFGLLTPNNLQQAIDRSGGKHGNKGIECAVAAIKMMAL
jgi:6,7-dimethyl-8-ribityllumazine synthase